jgi:hypothetical protein
MIHEATQVLSLPRNPGLIVMKCDVLGIRRNRYLGPRYSTPENEQEKRENERENQAQAERCTNYSSANSQPLVPGETNPKEINSSRSYYRNYPKYSYQGKVDDQQFGSL